MKRIMKPVIFACFMLIILFFTSCVPACIGLAYIDYENLDNNLNAFAVDKKLAAALENEYFEAVCEAVSDGANVDRTVTSIVSPLGEHDYSPISKCISNGNLSIARLLLESGADPNYNDESCSLLIYALSQQRYDIALELIEYGADVNYSSNGNCPLSEFVKSFRYYDYPVVTASSADAVFNYLINNGAVMPQSTLDEMILDADLYDLNYIQKLVQQGGYSLQSPIKEIILGDSDAALASLKKMTSIADDSKKYLIIFASAFCNANVIDRLVELGSDINTTAADGVNLLSVAARYNLPSVIKYFQDKGLTADFGGNSLKYCDYAAVLNRNADTQKYLYELKQTKNYSALSLACVYGNIDYIELNINYIKTLAEDDKQELVRLAAFSDSLEIIKVLNEAGVEDFASVAEYVGTMSIDTLEYLLTDCGLSPNDADTENTGTTAFRFAIASNNLEKVELMLKNGADVNKPYPEQSFYEDSSPIFTAVCCSDAEIAGYLIENGADIETKDSLGYTPLMSAVDALSYTMAELMVDNGAELNTKNDNNETAIDIASKNTITYEDEKMMRLLNNR